ncbi:MAG: integration host factor subunit beta [Bacteroidales bacterium]|nr:integration host factor subunit beta [Bacteroidales bacterium]
MTKAELVRQIADATGISADVVLTVVENEMTVIKNTLTAGESIFLRGFGTFTIKERAAKTARNISAGTSMDVPAHKVPAFKPCPEFKSMVKNK